MSILAHPDPMHQTSANLSRFRDEHYRREPDCRFFSLISSQPAPKKSGRTKAARSSKASRLSIQSFANLADISSMDATAEVDDSVLTTASNMTTASKASKKSTKAKKTTTTARGRKTRTKKDEVVEILEDPPEADAEMPPPPPPKPARVRKRTSDEMEDSATTTSEAPAPKKRHTKTRKARDSSAAENSQADTDMLDESEIVKKPAAKKGTRKASGTSKASGARVRKASASTTASTTTTTSTASPAPQIPNDEEIDRQLQADLERPLTDDEDVVANPVTKEATSVRSSPEVIRPTIEEDDPLSHTAKTDFAMFDPSPVEPTDAQIEADLQSMEDEMKVEQVEPEPEPAAEAEPEPEQAAIHVPKKGRKAGGVRKVSKQAAAKKTKEIAANIERAQARLTAEAEEPDEIAEADVSFGSSGTVVRKSSSRASLGSIVGTKGAAKRGRPKKMVSKDTLDEPATAPAMHEPEVPAPPSAMEIDEEPSKLAAEETKKRPGTNKRGRPPKNSKVPDIVTDDSAVAEAPAEPEAAVPDTKTETDAPQAEEKMPSLVDTPAKIARKPVPAPKDSPFAIREKSATTASGSTSQLFSGPPKTPRHQASPVQSAKQATVSPSPSPQASDAENRPPSSKPNTTSSKRMALGDLPTATPARSGSPSKQQQPVIGGLESSEPWTAIDLDLVFQDCHGNQENAQGAANQFFAKGGELTTPERNMSVEEWVYYNASQAEQKLKLECETMVMAFEREGTRALRALEGLVVE